MGVLDSERFTHSRVTLYTAGHLHTAVPHCSHSRAPIVHTAVPRENNEHGCVYLRCRAVCKLPGCVEGHPCHCTLKFKFSHFGQIIAGCTGNSQHRNGNVILMNLCQLAPPDIFKMHISCADLLRRKFTESTFSFRKTTTSGAASCKTLVKMTILCFQCMITCVPGVDTCGPQVSTPGTQVIIHWAAAWVWNNILQYLCNVITYPCP